MRREIKYCRNKYLNVIVLTDKELSEVKAAVFHNQERQEEKLIANVNMTSEERRILLARIMDAERLVEILRSSTVKIDAKKYKAENK